MPKGGQLGSGIRAGYSLSSPHSWLEIEEILDGTPPGFERDRVETTKHGDATIRRYVPGLADVSDTSLTLIADLDRVTTPSHLALADLEESQDLIWFRYEIPITSNLATTNFYVYEFQVRVSQWTLVTPIDGLKTIEVMFQFGGDNITRYENVASAF